WCALMHGILFCGLSLLFHLPCSQRVYSLSLSNSLSLTLVCTYTHTQTHTYTHTNTHIHTHTGAKLKDSSTVHCGISRCSHISGALLYNSQVECSIRRRGNKEKLVWGRPGVKESFLLSVRTEHRRAHRRLSKVPRG